MKLSKQEINVIKSEIEDRLFCSGIEETLMNNLNWCIENDYILDTDFNEVNYGLELLSIGSFRKSSGVHPLFAGFDEPVYENYLKRKVLVEKMQE